MLGRRAKRSDAREICKTPGCAGAPVSGAGGAAGHNARAGVGVTPLEARGMENDEGQGRKVKRRSRDALASRDGIVGC